jgi:hypothetical protein
VEDNVELSQYELVNVTTEQFPKYIREVGKCCLCNLHTRMKTCRYEDLRGMKQQEGGGRELHNEELHNSFSSPNIIRVIK